MKKCFAWFLLAGLIVLSGCRFVTINERARVSLGREPPGSNCKRLGHLVGRAGGSSGGDSLPNDRLTELALQDLRNQAARFGANYVQHDPPQMSQSENAPSITVSGTAYQCLESELEPATARITTPEPERLEDSVPPTGAAGFRFGSSITDANASCKQADGVWQPQTSTRIVCRDVSSVGIEAAVLLRFCDGLLCELRIDSENPSSTTFDRLRGALASRYGVPAQTSEPDADNRQRLRWSWKTGERVTLSRVEDRDGRPVVVSVLYSKSDVEPTLRGL